MRRRAHKALFITGTDTDVGKTTVACLLAKDARKAGFHVGVMKPFASGSWEDTGKLRSASGSTATQEEITPFFFKTPASAWAAALKEKVTVHLSEVDRVFRQLKHGCDILLVEGMGGVLVPITQAFLVADLIKRWRIPVLLVARWELGTLNHTLLSLEALHRREIPVAGLIFNQTRPGKIGLVQRTNVEYFRQRKFPRILATVQYSRHDSQRRLRWEAGIRFWEGPNHLW